MIAAMTIPSAYVYAHGIKSSSATIEVLPNRLVNIKVQFHIVDFLHNTPESRALPLQVLASMPKKMFALLYQSVLAIFDAELQVTLRSQASLNPKPVSLNLRLPTSEQAHRLLKRELVENNHSGQGSPPYTFDDRRFYQVFNYDFRLSTEQNIGDLNIIFPRELGEVYVSFITPQMRHVEPGKIWSFVDRAAKHLDSEYP